MQDAARGSALPGSPAPAASCGTGTGTSKSCEKRSSDDDILDVLPSFTSSPSRTTSDAKKPPLPATVDSGGGSSSTTLPPEPPPVTANSSLSPHTKKSAAASSVNASTSSASVGAAAWRDPGNYTMGNTIASKGQWQSVCCKSPDYIHLIRVVAFIVQKKKKKKDDRSDVLDASTSPASCTITTGCTINRQSQLLHPYTLSLRDIPLFEKNPKTCRPTSSAPAPPPVHPTPIPTSKSAPDRWCIWGDFDHRHVQPYPRIRCCEAHPLRRPFQLRRGVCKCEPALTSPQTPLPATLEYGRCSLEVT